MAWKNTDELLESIQQSTKRLVGGETPVDEAHAEARLLGVAAKIMALRLDHARMTGRLKQGSSLLPDMDLRNEGNK